MSSSIAIALTWAVIYWLLRTEAKEGERSSLTLWIPTIWVGIMGSRPVGAWFISSSYTDFSVAEGSPYDRIVLNSLILIGVIICIKRKVNWSDIIQDNKWLIFLYAYLLISVIWSNYPFVSFKRWFKVTGVIVMAFLIVSEPNPLKAIEIIIRRCSCILLPLSITLIKYFPQYGVQYDRWSGIRMGTGVATHKNSLGILCAITMFFIVNSLFQRWLKKELFKISRTRLMAELLLIFMGLFLMFGGGGTYSATSITIFVIGLFCVFYINIFNGVSQIIERNVKKTVLFCICIFVSFNSIIMPLATKLLKRNSSLSGRDDIWESIIELIQKKPVLGVGFGGYWVDVAASFDKHHGVLQSHNGYLEVLLQVGGVGLIMLIIFLFSFCRKISNMFNYNKNWGIFGLSFLLMLLFYNYTEACFLQSNLFWTVMILLTVVFSVSSKSTMNRNTF